MPEKPTILLMKSSLFFPVAAAAVACACSTLTAQTVLFSDSFNSYAPGALPSTNWGSVTQNGSTTLLAVLADSGSLLPANTFGEGTANQILRVLDTSTSDLTRMDRRDLSFQVATLSFDFYESSGVSGTPWRVFFGLNATSPTSNNSFRIDFNNGNSGAYSLDTVHRVDIAVNTSSSAVSYGTSGSVASLSYDLWIDGAFVQNGGLLSGSTFVGGANMTAFRFLTDSGGASQEVYIDNVTLFDGAHVGLPIPEPSSLALAGIAVFAGGFRRRISRR